MAAAVDLAVVKGKVTKPECLVPQQETCGPRVDRGVCDRLLVHSCMAAHFPVFPTFSIYSAEPPPQPVVPRVVSYPPDDIPLMHDAQRRTAEGEVKLKDKDQGEGCACGRAWRTSKAKRHERDTVATF